MDTKDTSKTEPAAEAAKGPIKVMRIDDVSVSIFDREAKSRQGITTYYSASFSRSYKDASGGSKYVKTFAPEDLGKVADLCKQAETYIQGLRK